MLIKLNDNGHIREKLFPDLPFHPEHILFMNQMLGGDINAQKILPPGARHLLHRNVLKQVMQSRIQF